MSDKCRSYDVSIAVHVVFPRWIKPTSPLVIKLFVPVDSLSADDGIALVNLALVSQAAPDRVTKMETRGQQVLTIEYDQPVKLPAPTRNRSNYLVDKLLQLATMAVVSRAMKQSQSNIR